MTLLTLAFAEAPNVDFQRTFFAFAGWTWQRWSRYILKKEDPVSLKGKIQIGARMLLENFNCLCTFFFIANPCFGLVQPPDTLQVTYDFAYVSVIVTVSLVHLMSVIMFNVDIPELRLGAMDYSGHKGVGLRQAVFKAFSNVFFPTVGRDWHEPQGPYGTDDSRKTREDIQRDWKRKLWEYAVIAGLYCIRNIVLMYPALKCFCLQGYYIILAIPVGLLLLWLFQVWLFKEYNEKNHPWHRLLKSKQELPQPENVLRSTKASKIFYDLKDSIKALYDQQGRNRDMPAVPQVPVELVQTMLKIRDLLHIGTTRFSDLYHAWEADKLRQSKMLEKAKTWEGSGEVLLTAAEEEQIEIAVEASRERIRKVQLLEYPLLVREYAKGVGETSTETLLKIIRYVLQKSSHYSDLEEADIDEILRLVELDPEIAKIIVLTIPDDKLQLSDDMDLD
jgi:hypothetical protein